MSAASAPAVEAGPATTATDGSRAAARAALATVVPRLTRLIRSISNRDAHAVGVWSVRDVAVHLAHAWEILPSLAREERESPLQDVNELAGVTRDLVSGEGPADLHAVADRIDAAAGRFLQQLEVGADGSLSPWLVNGIRVPMHTFACHLLNESLVHGYDIARAEHAPWRLDPAHVALVFNGFLFPMLQRLDARAMVDQEKSRRLHACWQLHIRHTTNIRLAVDDGQLRVNPDASRRTDCHIYADAVAFFLVLWGRRSQWSALATGRLFAWGRRPWLAATLRAVLRNP